MRMAYATIDAALVGHIVEHIIGVCRLFWHMRQLGRGGQNTTIGRRGCDGTRVHQSHICFLTFTRLAAFTVGEVAGGVADA